MNKSPINELFEKVLVLNLATRKDKLDIVSERLKTNNIVFDVFHGVTPMDIMINNEYERFRGIEFDKLGAVACAMSYKKMFEYCLAEGYTSVLFFEDDVNLIDDFNSKLSEKLKSLPANWNILHFGYNEAAFIMRNNIVKFYNINEDWNTFDGMAGIFCWGFKREIIPLILEYLKHYPLIGNPLNTLHVDLNLTFMGLYQNPYVRVYTPTEKLVSHDLIGHTNTGIC